MAVGCDVTVPLEDGRDVLDLVTMTGGRARSGVNEMSSCGLFTDWRTLSERSDPDPLSSSVSRSPLEYSPSSDNNNNHKLISLTSCSFNI